MEEETTVPEEETTEPVEPVIDTIEISNEEIELLFAVLDSMNQSLITLNDTLTMESEPVEDEEIIEEEIDHTTTELYQLENINDKLLAQEELLGRWFEAYESEINKVDNRQAEHAETITALESVVNTLETNNEQLNSLDSHAFFLNTWLVPAGLVVFIGWWVLKQFI